MDLSLAELGQHSVGLVNSQRHCSCITGRGSLLTVVLSGRLFGRHQGMLAYVKRRTVKISDALDARLRHEAERRNLTIAEITRDALEAYFGASGGRRRLGAAGAGRSGRTDISERIEEILAEVGS
ncbi:ribbon-helix-helix domain-containing protein [Mycobacterium lacus]|uniref:Ribbon-helix-helix protein CopG domain-containing protein n=1 Tax=Mycobacterium lacus TaxID=169765 RepID=A0A7I7NP72_9MYCO|nr:CopG family transcriptional regulator [Mycobacterium lacus]BBX98456.1 hypothetical protein MLAC_37500 [Mycobacterium lacus]